MDTNEGPPRHSRRAVLGGILALLAGTACSGLPGGGATAEATVVTPDEPEALPQPAVPQVTVRVATAETDYTELIRQELFNIYTETGVAVGLYSRHEDILANLGKAGYMSPDAIDVYSSHNETPDSIYAHVQVIKKALKKYPEDFLTTIGVGTIAILPDTDNEQEGGKSHIPQKFFTMYQRDEYANHHEIGHFLTEDMVIWNNFMAINWISGNQYAGEHGWQSSTDPDFITMYAHSNPFEEVAELFAYMMTDEKFSELMSKADTNPYYCCKNHNYFNIGAQ